MRQKANISPMKTRSLDRETANQVSEQSDVDAQPKVNREQIIGVELKSESLQECIEQIFKKIGDMEIELKF